MAQIPIHFTTCSLSFYASQWIDLRGPLLYWYVISSIISFFSQIVTTNLSPNKLSICLFVMYEAFFFVDKMSFF